MLTYHYAYVDLSILEPNGNKLYIALIPYCGLNHYFFSIYNVLR